MAVYQLAELTWEEVAALDRARTTVILPIGAIEAHGPHLPLSTDVTIAGAMAQAMAQQHPDRVWLILPAVSYSVAHFAAGFAGTLSIQPETATSLLVDIARAVAAQGFRILVIANAHFDPAHLAAIYAAIEKAPPELRVIFPDITRKPLASRLTEEFKSGACHAGQYETSIMLAVAPEAVRKVGQTLPPNPISLSQAIRAGKRTFEEAGGPRAYFGNPATATGEEGKEILRILGDTLPPANVLEP